MSIRDTANICTRFIFWMPQQVCLVAVSSKILKGVRLEVIRFKFFFHESVPPWISYLGRFEFFLKFAEIIANVYQRRQRHRRFKDKKFTFYILLRVELSALYTYRFNFCSFFIFRCRQADICSTVLLPVSTTPVNKHSFVNISAKTKKLYTKVTPIMACFAVSH
jgi:hypothetical protein